MKVIVFSDSHSDVLGMQKAVELEAPDVLIHLGDYFSDFLKLKREFPQLCCYGVAGNCDKGQEPLSSVLQIDGISFFLTHGHRYHVKSGLISFYYAALEQKAHIALYGHTHIPQVDCINGLTLLNPGSIGTGTRKTYAIIETDGEHFSYRITELTN